MRPRSSKQRLTALAVVLLLLGGPAGCIGRYGYPARLPVAGPALPQDPSRRGPLAVKVQAPNGQDSFFVERLADLSVHSVSTADAPPPAGRFVAITVTEVPNSPAAQVWGIVSIITLFIIPAYSDSSGYDLAFETFVDGQQAGSYHYSIRERIFVWFAVLPVIWINFLTRSRNEAFTEAISRFLGDSGADGF